MHGTRIPIGFSWIDSWRKTSAKILLLKRRGIKRRGECSRHISVCELLLNISLAFCSDVRTSGSCLQQWWKEFIFPKITRIWNARGRRTSCCRHIYIFQYNLHNYISMPDKFSLNVAYSIFTYFISHILSLAYLKFNENACHIDERA